MYGDMLLNHTSNKVDFTPKTSLDQYICQKYILPLFEKILHEEVSLHAIFFISLCTKMAVAEYKLIWLKS